MRTGKLPLSNGLCQEFNDPKEFRIKVFEFIELHPLFDLFMKEKKEYRDGPYWASDTDVINDFQDFGGLRQTIVLLMAAMNDEL